MTLALRIGGLAATGAVVAGLAHAGWLAAAWAIARPAATAAELWWSIAPQISLTGALAAAVAWAAARQLEPLRQSLARLREQADALEQGRFVVVDDAVPPEAQALASSLNAAVRRLQAVTEQPQQRTLDALRRSSPQDPVTGVDSRFTFLRHLTERLADASSPDTAVIVARLMPAATGVPADDDVPTDADTIALADLLRAYPQRVEGAFVGRLGDRDFALCLPAHGVAHDSAASLMAAVQAPHRLRCVIAAIDHLGGVSLGTALAQIETTVARAEAGGSGNVEWRSGRDHGVADAADAGVRRAIVEALRAGQTRLAEFPVVDGAGRLLHLECPMRLQLAADGRYEPAERWLSTASRYRLMTQIDLSGLELALQAIERDQQPRCVHIAAESLATAGFVSAVRSRLEAQPAAAARLWIEISEVSFERLPPRLRNAGTVWRRCGARVGIEHAGAALRSLVRLGELELDYVKVAAEYVRDLAHDEGQRERTRSLVAFVHEFGARVIAEGVDDDADLEAAWALGFDGVTGRAVTRLQDLDADADGRPGRPSTRDQAMSPA